MDITSASNSKITDFLLVLTMLVALIPWPVFSIVSTISMTIILLALIFLAFISGYKCFNINSNAIGVAVLMYIAMCLSSRGNLNSYIAHALEVIPLVLMLSYRSEFIPGLLNTFNKVFSIIIAVSLLGWLIHLVGIETPHETLIPSETSNYIYDNYYFFLIMYEDRIFQRFCSIFLEPGYLSCFMALLIYINGYDFKKWYNILYFIAIIATFSLAGWLLFFMIFLPVLFKQSSRRLRYILGIAIIAIIFVNLNSSQDSIMYQMIGYRLENDAGYAGYNRTTEAFEDYWTQHFWSNSSDVLIGLGPTAFESMSFGTCVDFRSFIVRYGVITAIVYWIFVWQIFRKRKTYKGLWLFAFWAYIVYRGFTLMYSNAFFFLMIMGLELFIQENEQQELQIN